MPEIFSIAAADGTTNKFVLGSGAWATNRSAGTAQSVDATNISGNVTTQNVSARGSEVAQIQRAFFSFDTSGITVTPSAATLKIYGYFRATADVIAVRSTHAALGTLANGDFDALYGASTALAASDADGAGTLAGISGLTYSAEISTWSNSGYNDIALNATALADMVSLDTFKVAVIDYDRDYLDVCPVGTSFAGAGMYFANNTGTSKDPKIDYTAGAAGYGNAVMGVASANIGKINGIATANVEKVIGV